MAHILPLQPDGPTLQETTEKIVNELKSRGNFDTFRKACLADVDTRPAYQNLRQRVESTVTTFLGKQKWTPDLNRNQLREKLRKHLTESRFLEIGVDRIVDQVVDRNIYSTYMPQIQLLVKEMLDIKDEAEDKIDDDVEMEEATPAPETGGNTFGTWANQFHARVPEPRPDEPVAASNSSMSISSATNESAAGSASEAESPDIRAQMSPLSDDGKQGWGSFLGKADGLDFSGIMNRVGHMDPAIDQMIKSELETDTREAEASHAPPVSAQRSGSSNSNMSLDEEEPVDLQSFVGPPEGADSQDGYRRDADREPPLPPRPPRDEPDRGGRSDAEPRGGRHPSDEERRRRERERDRDRGRRERSRHDDERSRHGDEDRHRRDRDRDRERDRDRDRDRRDRDRGDDHEEQRSRGRHHQRRDRDDDDTSGHRGRSGGHSHGGRGHGRDDDRGGGGGGGGGSGQRYHGYGTGRERPAGVEGEVVDGVASEEVVVVESGKEAETVAVTVKTESGEMGKFDTSSEGERTSKKDTSRERKDLSKERDRKAASKERDRKRSGSGSRRRESSSAHKKSSRRRDRSSERRSSSKKTGSSSEKHSDKSRKLASSVERSSTNTPSSPRTSPLEGKSAASASKGLTAESAPKINIDSGNSPEGAIKPVNSTNSSSSGLSSSRKSESSKYKSHPRDLNDKLSKCAVVFIEKMSKSMIKNKLSSNSSSSSASKSTASSSTKPEQPASKFDSGSKTPLSAKDRMAQLMEKYAPYLKERFRRTEHASKPKPKPKPRPPQNTYLGERERPVSPSSRSKVQCLRQVVAEPDTLSVSSVDTADLSDFDDRLEMELELTEPERDNLLRIGWRPVVDDLADIDDDVLATAAEDLVQVVDICDDVESVDSGFNRSDASSSTSAGSGRSRLPAAVSAEPPLIDLEPAPVAGRHRRQRKVDYITLNSGLDGEDKAAEPTHRRRRPRDDGDWSPAAKASRVGSSTGVDLVPRVSLQRLPRGKLRGTLDKEEWHVSSDKENMDGMTRLRDPGAAGDSVRIRPNLAI